MSYVNVAFDKGGILNDFTLLHFGQWPVLYHAGKQMQAYTQTRDGQPKAILEGCLVIANITNATISARHHANLLTRKPLQKHVKEDLSNLQSKATRALTCFYPFIPNK